MGISCGESFGVRSTVGCGASPTICRMCSDCTRARTAHGRTGVCIQQLPLSQGARGRAGGGAKLRNQPSHFSARDQSGARDFFRQHRCSLSPSPVLRSAATTTRRAWPSLHTALSRMRSTQGSASRAFAVGSLARGTGATRAMWLGTALWRASPTLSPTWLRPCATGASATMLSASCATRAQRRARRIASRPAST